MEQETELHFYHLLSYVSSLKQELGEREDLESWSWPDDPQRRRSIRLPEGYTLEEGLGCSLDDLKSLGLTDNFQTTDGTNFYHFDG